MCMTTSVASTPSVKSEITDQNAFVRLDMKEMPTKSASLSENVS